MTKEVKKSLEKWTKPYGFYVLSIGCLIIFEIAIYMKGGVQVTNSLMLFMMGFGLVMYCVTILYNRRKINIQKYSDFKFMVRSEWYWIVIVFAIVVLMIVLGITLIDQSPFGAHMTFLIFSVLLISVMPAKVFKEKMGANHGT